MQNIKIENARKILDVGNKAIEIEDNEKHLFIADAKSKEEIMKKLKPSLIIKEDEIALKPLVYNLPDGLTVKGLCKRTKDNRIIGVLKVELANGLPFMHNKETEYSSYELFQKEAQELAGRILMEKIKYLSMNKGEADNEKRNHNTEPREYCK